MTRSVHQRAAGTRRAPRAAAAAGLAAALAISGVGAAAPALAADGVPAPTAHYDMSRAGGSLLDVSGNARHAALTGIGDDAFMAVDGARVLRLAGDGFASLPAGAVTAQDNDFAVEFTVTARTAQNQFGWVIGDGIGEWNTTALGNHVFVNPLSADGSYSGQVLSGIRVKTGSSNGEVRLPPGGGLNPGFTTLTLVGDDDTLTLYRDGEVASSVTHGNAMSSIVPAGPVLGYLGRSLYRPDALLKADVLDMKIWDVALTPAQVAASMPSAEVKARATDAVIRTDITPTLLGKNPSLDAVTQDLTLPPTLNGIGLTWSSSRPDVVSTAGEVSRTVAEDTSVTLTAATSTGRTITFALTVRAAVASDDLDAIVLKSPTTENLPLATEGAVNGATITWTSSDSSLVTPTDPDYRAPEVGAADPFAGGGIVARPAYGDGDREVTLTATARIGERTASRTYTVTVAEKARSAPDAGYAAAYFRSDSDEKIYQAATSGNDFFTFSPVNGGRPVISSTADTTGLRDPYILRSAEGDKYYMIATDLCIGCGTGWGPAQSEGSLKVHVWESTDLVDWQRTNGENAGITVNQPAAGMTWAPEAYWDDELQSYVVFFSSRLYADASHSNTDNLYARVFYVLTRDFTTFTYPPQSWQDTGHARIDSTVQKIGEYYYRFTKNEEGGPADGLEAGKDVFLERSKVLTAPTTRSDWSADPERTWQLTDTRMTSLETGQAGEGPQIIKLNDGDPNNTADGDGYVFLVDNYGAGGYRAFVTTGDEIAGSSRDDRLSQRPTWNVRAPGGLPASPRHGSFVSVSQSVLDAMRSWSSVQAVASTTVASAEGGTVSARVTAADGGEVAGTVTFAGGAWSQSVALRDGRASVEVPAGVSAIVAAYDGYRDGRVSPSQSEPVELAALRVDATAMARCVAAKAIQVITVSNNGDGPAVVRLAGAFGDKTVTVAAGRSLSTSFSTRLGDVGTQVVAMTATAGDLTRAADIVVPGISCR